MRLLILLSTLIVSTVYNFFKPSKKNASDTAVTNTTMVTNAATTRKTHPAYEGNLSDFTKGTWRMVSVVSDKPCDTDGDGVETTDIFSETPACAKDDLMEVQANHKVIFTRNQRCALTERAVETYKWTMGKNGAFTIVDGSVEAKMLLKSVTPTKLVMEIPMEAQGEWYRFTVTYEQVVQP